MSTGCLDKAVAYVRRLSEPAMHGQTDRQLLDRFTRNQDELAFAELVRRHGPMVLATCLRVVGHEQDAEDAFQAAFLVLARRASTIRQHACVVGWLYQVTYRIALRARMLSARRQARTVALEGEPAAPIADRAQMTLQATLEQELSLLPESYRSALVLCYLEGKSQREAASLLETSSDAVNSRLKRARDLLRQRLARHRVVLSAVALTGALAATTAQASLTPEQITLATRSALGSASGASAAALALAKGALSTMVPAPLKVFAALALALAMITSGAFWMPSHTQDEPRAPGRDTNALPAPPAFPELPKAKEEAGKKPRRCIVIWLSGGPSQIDTFDPKAGDIAQFKAIHTSVKGVQFSETLPLLAKQAHHLAVLRGVSHREGDHNRASALMRTGQVPGDVKFPSLPCALGKELGGEAPKLPRLISIHPGWKDAPGFGPGFLGAKYAPLVAGGVGFFPKGADVALPELEAFESLDKENGAAMRKALARTFDLNDEKQAVRDAYGPSRFGKGCLLARRLSEAGVPVVEITLQGWDMHGNLPAAMAGVGADFDKGLASLVNDLHERKLLDSTLIVVMGEFGRTPRINNAKGRDHWPMSQSVVLASAGIKGGQVHGKTSADGATVEEGKVSPPELLATIYAALAIDPHKTNRTENKQIPLVERGNNAVKALLR